MKIIRNDKLIKRNSKISQYVLFISLATLAVGIYFALKFNTADKIGWAYLSLIPSFFLVQLSSRMRNRWSRSPRPDEVVTQSLKGLDNQYSLYIYTTTAPHLLIGPAGIWIIKTYYQSGTIFLDEKKNILKQKGGGNFFSKIFLSEGVGNVIRDSNDLKKRLEKFFQNAGISDHPEIKAVSVFIDPNVVVDIPKFDEVVISSAKLKDFMRRMAKQVNLLPAVIEPIVDKLPKEQNI